MDPNRYSKEKKIKASGAKPSQINHPFIKKKYRKIADAIARRLIDTKITPNQISILSFLILGLSAYFFFRADYPSLIIAAILLQLGHLFDYVDGSLSRMRRSANAYGDWFDQLSGVYGYALVYIGVTLGVYKSIPKPYILILGFLGIIGALIKNYTQNLYFNNFKYAYSLGQKMYKKVGFIMFFRATAPFFNMLLALGAIFNKVHWILIFRGIYSPLYVIGENIIFTLKARKEFLKKQKE